MICVVWTLNIEQSMPKVQDKGLQYQKCNAVMPGVILPQELWFPCYYDCDTNTLL